MPLPAAETSGRDSPSCRHAGKKASTFISGITPYYASCSDHVTALVSDMISPHELYYPTTPEAWALTLFQPGYISVNRGRKSQPRAVR